VTEAARPVPVLDDRWLVVAAVTVVAAGAAKPDIVENAWRVAVPTRNRNA
jgi:hypothetical protein